MSTEGSVQKQTVLSKKLSEEEVSFLEYKSIINEVYSTLCIMHENGLKLDEALAFDLAYEVLNTVRHSKQNTDELQQQRTELASELKTLIESKSDHSQQIHLPEEKCSEHVKKLQKQTDILSKSIVIFGKWQKNDYVINDPVALKIACQALVTAMGDDKRLEIQEYIAKISVKIVLAEFATLQKEGIKFDESLAFAFADEAFQTAIQTMREGDEIQGQIAELKRDLETIQDSKRVPFDDDLELNEDERLEGKKELPEKIKFLRDDIKRSIAYQQDGVAIRQTALLIARQAIVTATGEHRTPEVRKYLRKMDAVVILSTLDHLHQRNEKIDKKLAFNLACEVLKIVKDPKLAGDEIQGQINQLLSNLESHQQNEMVCSQEEEKLTEDERLKRKKINEFLGYTLEVLQCWQINAVEMNDQTAILIARQAIITAKNEDSSPTVKECLQKINGALEAYNLPERQPSKIEYAQTGLSVMALLSGVPTVGLGFAIQFFAVTVPFAAVVSPAGFLIGVLALKMVLSIFEEDSADVHEAPNMNEHGVDRSNEVSPHSTRRTSVSCFSPFFRGRKAPQCKAEERYENPARSPSQDPRYEDPAAGTGLSPANA